MDKSRSIFEEKRNQLIIQYFFLEQYVNRKIFLEYDFNVDLLNYLSVELSIEDEEARIDDTRKYKNGEEIELQNKSRIYKEFLKINNEILDKYEMRLDWACYHADMVKVVYHIKENDIKYMPLPFYRRAPACPINELFEIAMITFGYNRPSKNDRDIATLVQKKLLKDTNPLDEEYNNQEIDKKRAANIALRIFYGKHDELTKEEFIFAAGYIDHMLVDDFRSSGEINRALGLLYWDWLQMRYEGKDMMTNDFMDFLTNYNIYPFQKDRLNSSYAEYDKRRLREALRTASLCIDRKKTLPVREKGAFTMPTKRKWEPFFNDEYYKLLKKA